MTLRPQAIAALLLVPTVMLAGCASCPDSGPPVTARGIGAGAPVEDGSDDYTLSILVTDEPGGSPIPGAGVVVYWARDAPADWMGNASSVVVEGGGSAGAGGAEGGGSVRVAAPGSLDPTPAASSALRLRTGDDGVAVARLPTNRIVGVVSAADGFTEEWIPALATGSAAASDLLQIALYRSTIETRLEGAWDRGASTGFVSRNNYAWKAEPLPFGPTAEARRAYLERVVELVVVLEWTNGITGGGDLGIGVGPTRSEPTVVEDRGSDLAPGAKREEVVLDATALRAAGVLGAPDGYVGALTKSAAGGLPAFPYVVTVTARFDTAIAARAKCATDARSEGSSTPGASVPLSTIAPIAGLVLAAAIARRRTNPIAPATDR